MKKYINVESGISKKNTAAKLTFQIFKSWKLS